MSESKDSAQSVRKLKEGVKLKTKPAVVPKYRKIKSGRTKLPMAAMMPKGITVWNIIFSTLFLGLLVTTIVNSYFIEFLSIPLPDLFLKYLIPVALIIEVFLVLIAFEAKAISFPKIHTRHSVKRIMVVGFIIGSLLVSFFTPYFNLIGKYRDLPPGEITPMNTNPSWFNSIFTGDAPFYIDGILDLLDNMDLDPDLDIDVIAHVNANNGTLGDYLYRWDIREYYQASSWDFIETSGDTRFDVPSAYYNPDNQIDKPGDYHELDITQLVYSVQTALLTQLISPWSNNYNKPFLTNDLNWTDNLYNENGTAAVDGTVSVKHNLNNMLSLKATTNQIGFFGNFSYQTHFVSDDNISAIIADSIDYNNPALYSSWFNSTYARFLQKPLNYKTISPGVAAYAAAASAYGKTNGHSTYQQTTYILEKIVSDFGLPTADGGDNNGQDRAQLLIDGLDSSASAYIALAIMTLRLNNIPCRPVIGFALGDGSATSRTLSLSENLYAWVEALVPVDNGAGGIAYKWGQYQMGPYIDEDTSTLHYCENTLYSSFDIDIAMFGEPLLYLPVIQQDLGGGQYVYINDYGRNYTLRATVSDDTGLVEGATVNYATVTAGQLQTYQTNPAALLAVANNIGTAITDVSGVAELYSVWNPLVYDIYNPSNPLGTAYVLLAYVTLLSTNYTGFIIVPTGYLTGVSINATQETIPNPSPPPVGVFDLFLVQRGVQYQISTELFEDENLTIPLEGRLVTYYILDENEKNDLLLGTLDPATLRVLGQELTDSNGNTTINTMQGSTSIFSTLTPQVTPGAVYYIAAIFGQNYTFTIILYFDGKYSTVDSSDYFHNKGTDGEFFTPDVDIYLYQEPPGGLPSPMIGEDVEVWLVKQSIYDAADTTDSTTLRADLVAASIAEPYGANIVATGTTDVNGFYNTTLNVNVTQYGPSFYRLVVLYLDTWNISSQITITFPPAYMSYSMVITESSEPTQILLIYNIREYMPHVAELRNTEHFADKNCLVLLPSKDVKY